MNGHQGRGLDLEYDTESRQSSHDSVPEPAMYETAYVTSHKGNLVYKSFYIFCRQFWYMFWNILVTTNPHWSGMLDTVQQI